LGAETRYAQIEQVHHSQLCIPTLVMGKVTVIGTIYNLWADF